MNISEELQKLAALRQSGTLTEEEFSAAKKHLLSGSALHSTSINNEALGRAANRYITFQIVMFVIATIIVLIFIFAVMVPNFSAVRASPQVPSTGKP